MFTDTLNGVQVRHSDKRLARMEVDPAFDGGFGQAVAQAFRKRLNFIRAAVDERAFYAMKSLHHEKLKGSRADERSMRLNDQMRLILRIEKAPQRTVIVLAIEDYR